MTNTTWTPSVSILPTEDGVAVTVEDSDNDLMVEVSFVSTDDAADIHPKVHVSRDFKRRTPRE